MTQPTQHDLLVFFLALALLLGLARLLGELARRLHQPAVVGEMLAGVALGPTLLGRLAPETQAWLFPTGGYFAPALSGVTNLGIALFLLVAGLEVNLSSVFKQGRSALLISLMGMVIPFAVGLAAGWLLPAGWVMEAPVSRGLFALFFGTALAISALPVIAKILLDIGYYRSDFGMLVISSAVLDDLAGWILFAMLLGLLGQGAQLHPAAVIASVLLFTLLILTVGRLLIHKLLPLVQAYTAWPSGELGLAISGGLFCAALTEGLGVHAIFGAFLFGVALGDSSHLRERTRFILEHFISVIFAPLFFASIGLKVDFAQHFDLLLCLAVIAVATLGKLVGCGWAARLSGLSWRESLAVGIGMNARGAMGIILALLARQAGVIGDRMFVALVVMAIVTSMVAGGFLRRALGRPQQRRFFEYLSAGAFARRLAGATPREAIDELSQLVARASGLEPSAIANAVWARERTLSTGLGAGLAAPHARLAGLKAPLLALGISERGIDFDAPDGERARLIAMILTPENQHRAQLEILSDFTRSFHGTNLLSRVQDAAGYVEFLALLRSDHRE